MSPSKSHLFILLSELPTPSVSVQFWQNRALSITEMTKWKVGMVLFHIRQSDEVQGGSKAVAEFFKSEIWKQPAVGACNSIGFYLILTNLDSSYRRDDELKGLYGTILNSTIRRGSGGFESCCRIISRKFWNNLLSELPTPSFSVQCWLNMALSIGEIMK